MATVSSETLHATCVAIDGRAILIEGPSGSGKSDLALRLIDRGAALVSDDYTICRRVGTRLLAQPPATIAGRMEVRGIGIMPMPYVTDIPISLLIRAADGPERLPELSLSREIAGIAVREVALSLREGSAPAKVALALRHLGATEA